MNKFLVAFVVGVLQAFRLPRPPQGAQTNFIRRKPTMKKPRKLFASVLAALTIIMIASSAQAITYQVNQSWGGGTATLVGTVDVALGNYTIMNGGVDPFMNVMLTLTVNGTPFTLDHASTFQIFGTGEFFIDATMTSLTFDTANSDEENPADLNFYDSINTNRYALGSNGNPHFEVAITTAGDVSDDISFPFLFGTAATGALELTSAASRKTHGTKGAFDINLPLTGDVGIECRSGLTRYTIVFTFNNDVTGADSATSTCGTVSSIAVDPANAHNLLVSFNGATCNAQTVTVTLTNVHDSLGNTLGSASASVGILVGDVLGVGHVGNGDIGNVQGHLGEQTDSTNFRDDVTVDGRINNQDVQTVRSYRGTSLP